MNPEQLAYTKRINSLRNYLGVYTEILNKLIRECKHLIVCMHDFGGAYCDICGESFGWYCKKSPVLYCEYGEEDYINCKHCGQPRSRK